jgi:endo-chitodextinase
MKNNRKLLLILTTITAAVLLSYSGICADNLNISGYWENWKCALNNGDVTDVGSPEYYKTDLNNFNHIYYSFLTLAKTPNPDTPADASWDGTALYESMTQADIMDVLKVGDWTYNWQGQKIRAMLKYSKEKNKKFIWAIGGWSDLKRTLNDDQVPLFVNKCVELLANAGDGIDFDWEHLSTNKGDITQQRRVLGKIIPRLRKALDKANMQEKSISYTTRFNAFWSNSDKPEGSGDFVSNGEGIDIANAVKEEGTTLGDCITWVNIMMYDVPAKDATGIDRETFDLSCYRLVLSYFKKYLPKDKIIMGFEPGGQVAGGVWEGAEVDKEVIDYLIANKYGGVYFWAINAPAYGTSKEITGQNAQGLAGYAKSNYTNDAGSIVQL